MDDRRIGRFTDTGVFESVTGQALMNCKKLI